MKNALKASARDGGTLRYRLQRFLLAYRIAPHAVTGRSPAELMLGWHPRTRLDHLRPDLLRRVKDAQEKEVDRKPVVDRALQVDDDVWARCFTGRDKWRLGRIRAATGPRSFEVDVGDDVIWSRHADQLWPANNRRATPRPAQDTTVRPGVTPLPVREAPPPVYLTPSVQEQQRGSNQTAEEDIRPSAERGPPTPTDVGPLAEQGPSTPTDVGPSAERGPPTGTSRKYSPESTPSRQTPPREPLTTPEPPIALRRLKRLTKPPARYRTE